MGLTLDEFALWLNLEDVYWGEKGRESIDAVILTGVLLTLALMGLQFWIDTLEAVAIYFGLGDDQLSGGESARSWCRSRCSASSSPSPAS